MSGRISWGSRHDVPHAREHRLTDGQYAALWLIGGVLVMAGMLALMIWLRG